MHFVRGDFSGHRVATQRAQGAGALRPLRHGVQRRRHADGPSAGRNPPGQTGDGGRQTVTRAPAATVCRAATVTSAPGTITFGHTANAGDSATVTTVSGPGTVTSTDGAANLARRTAAGHVADFGRDARGIHAQRLVAVRGRAHCAGAERRNRRAGDAAAFTVTANGPTAAAAVITAGGAKSQTATGSPRPG